MYRPLCMCMCALVCGPHETVARALRPASPLYTTSTTSIYGACTLISPITVVQIYITRQRGPAPRTEHLSYSIR